VTRLILTVQAWLAELGRYLGVFEAEGWAGLVATLEIDRASKQVANVYGYIEHESDLHDQQMAYLRTELDKCRRRLYQLQHELQQLRKAT
jgi:uncharacterized protein YlxW (UPF0749 family)